jgi:monothiol bacilliredoxin
MPNQITDRDDLEKALTSLRFLLFKHSKVCPISARAFSRYGRFAAAHPEIPTGWIDVIGQRPWSHFVAKETGIEHESPQAIFIRNSEAVWDASHRDITETSLGEALSR